MANTTSANLKLTVQATGENSGTWGQITNTNLLILEQAIGGYDAVALNATTGATLTFSNGALSNGKNQVLKLTGTITANVDVIVPDSIEKTYIVENATSGAFTVTVKTTSGTGVTWAATDKGKKMVYSDGTNVVDTAFTEVVSDVSPQLGGNLDLNNQGISGQGTINVTGGSLLLKSNAPSGTNNGPIIGSNTANGVSGFGNMALGTNAGRDFGNCTGNIAVGTGTLLRTTTGGNNVGVGREALRQNTTASSNTGVGYQALDNTTSNGNTAVGASAGSTLTNGQNNTLLGASAQPSSATVSNEVTIGNSNVTSLRIPGLQSGASANDVLTFNGTDITLAAPSGGGLSWQPVITTNTTATASQGFFVNTSGGAVTLTLPATPTQGDEVAFVDYAGTAATNNITIGRNGENIQGSGSDLIINTNRAANTLVYADATQGWLLKNV